MIRGDDQSAFAVRSAGGAVAGWVSNDLDREAQALGAARHFGHDDIATLIEGVDSGTTL